jgi:hypothetical protein
VRASARRHAECRRVLVLVDEVPLLALAAARALAGPYSGGSRLRLKESDRLAAVLEMLELGVPEDWTKTTSAEACGPCAWTREITAWRCCEPCWPWWCRDPRVGKTPVAVVARVLR